MQNASWASLTGAWLAFFLVVAALKMAKIIYDVKKNIEFFFIDGVLSFFAMPPKFRGVTLIRLNIEKIEELMERRNFASQAQLARASGWAPRAFNQIVKETERGNSPSFTMNKLNGLCNALRCKVSTILIHDLDPAE